MVLPIKEVCGSEGLVDEYPTSFYLTMLVIIYLAVDLSQGHLQGIGSGGEAKPVVGLFKCSWLNLGSSLIGSCGVRTGGLGVSMMIMEPEEGGVVAVSKTPGLGLVGIFAPGTSSSDVASSSEGGGKEVDSSAKGRYNGT
jgi:hypothetical protein